MPAVEPRASAGPSPALPPPGDGEVDLWLCAPSVLTDDLRAAYGGFLSPSELSRLQRFRVRHAADEFLLGRALIRTSLSHYAIVAPSAWEFGIGPHGKPFVAGPAPCPPLAFNISHTTGLVACAIGHDSQLGVDVEHCGRDLDLRGFSAANFAPAEQAAVDAAAEADLRATFFRIWTLKEAFIKGLGLGLNLPLESFWFDMEAPPRLSWPDGDVSGWRFLHQAPTPDHRLSLALATQRPTELRVRVRWTVPDPSWALAHPVPATAHAS